MLTELIFKDRFYICGTAKEVLQRLAEHRQRYTTVKELLNYMSPR